MDDLFDKVKAAPPPDMVRSPPTRMKRFHNTSPAFSLPLPSPPPPSPPLSDNDTTLNDKDNSSVGLKRAIIRIKRFSLQEHTTDMIENKKAKMTTKSTIVAALQSSADEIRSCLTKTKAQQKQFDDELPLTNTTNTNTNYASESAMEKTTEAPKKQKIPFPSQKIKGIQQCHVRIRRLSAKEIESYLSGRQGGNRAQARKTAVLGKHLPVKPKSVNSRKSKPNNSFGTSCNERYSPLTKQKMKIQNGQSPIHFKITSKGARYGNLKGRRSTPPPGATTTSRFLAKSHPKRSSTMSMSKLVSQFGSRIFRCYVRMLRCKHPVAQAFELSNERSRKSRRPNLSVSFRDSVEIIGQSALAAMLEATPDVSANSVPTRLTKVENGKVVEDVALDQSLFTMPSTIINVKRQRKKRSYSLGCETSERDSLRRARKVARRSGETIPLSDMARLRIDDSNNETDEDYDEYIVPNELPQRRSTTDTNNLTALQLTTRCVLKSLPPLTPTTAESKEAKPTRAPMLTIDQSSIDVDVGACEEGPERQNVNKPLESSPINPIVLKTETASETTTNEAKAPIQLKTEKDDENLLVKNECTIPAKILLRRSPSVSSEASFRSATNSADQANGTSPQLKPNITDAAKKPDLESEDNAVEAKTNISKDSDDMPAKASANKAATCSSLSSFIVSEDKSRNVAEVKHTSHNISPITVTAELDNEKRDDLDKSDKKEAPMLASCSQHSNTSSQSLCKDSTIDATDADNDCINEVDDIKRGQLAVSESPTTVPQFPLSDEIAEPLVAENKTLSSFDDILDLGADDDLRNDDGGGEYGN